VISKKIKKIHFLTKIGIFEKIASQGA